MEKILQFFLQSSCFSLLMGRAIFFALSFFQTLVWVVRYFPLLRHFIQIWRAKHKMITQFIRKFSVSLVAQQFDSAPF